MATGLRETQGTAHSGLFVRVNPGSGDPIQPSGQSNRPGRRQSIPADLWPEVARLKQSGLGYQRVAIELGKLGVLTSRGSVERCVKRLGCYQ